MRQSNTSFCMTHITTAFSSNLPSTRALAQLRGEGIWVRAV